MKGLMGGRTGEADEPQGAETDDSTSRMEKNLQAILAQARVQYKERGYKIFVLYISIFTDLIC